MPVMIRATTVKMTLLILMISILFSSALPAQQQQRPKQKTQQQSQAAPARSAAKSSSGPAPKTPTGPAAASSAKQQPKQQQQQQSNGPPGAKSPTPYKGQIAKDAEKAAQQANKDPSAAPYADFTKKNAEDYQRNYGPHYIPPPPPSNMKPASQYGPPRHQLDGLGPGWKSDQNTGKIDPKTGQPNSLPMSSYPTEGYVKHMRKNAYGNSRVAPVDPAKADTADQRLADRQAVQYNQGILGEPSSTYKHISPED